MIDLRDGELVVADGRITACRAADHSTPSSGRLIIPGFVDCHSHIPQLDCRGKHGSTLLSWLEQYIFPAEMAFADLALVENVATRFFKKLILNGTTTAALHATIHATSTHRCFEIAEAAGVRVVLGKVMMDQHAPTGLLEKTHQSLSQSEKLCAQWHGKAFGRLHYAFTPRFAPTCSKKLWQETAKLVEQSGAYVQTHLAETVEENARVRELFPEFQNPFELMEETGCCGKKALFAHSIYLDDGALKRMEKTHSKIAHCPTSNFFLKSGVFPMERVERAGITFGLGTDVGAGTSMSLMKEMRNADYTQRDGGVPPYKAFYLATLGGAKALEMGHEIGNFEIGKAADFCMVDIAAIDPQYRLSDLDTNELLSLLIYRGDSRCIESTYVNGKRLDVDALSL